MGQTASISARLAELRREWPQTAAVLEETYWKGRDAGVTLTGGENDAGYALWGLRRFRDIVEKLHAQHGYTVAELDVAASAEVRYHWRRGTVMRRPVAVFVKAWAVLPSERPERLEDARRAVCSHGGAEVKASRAVSSTFDTGMRSSARSSKSVAEHLLDSLSGSLASKTWTNIGGSTIGGQPERSRPLSCWPGRHSASFRGGHGQILTGG